VDLRVASPERGRVEFAPPWSNAPEELLGELAQALEARVARRSRRDGDEAELLFRAEALAPLERARLLAAATHTAPAAAAGQLTRARFPVDVLRQLGESHAFARPLSAAWQAFRAPRPTPGVLGIVNVTPDSFSDGGQHLRPESAIAHGEELARLGADGLDVGGESTRPGAAPVAGEEELERVLPVVAALAVRAPVSIDTTKVRVAEAAFAAGASILNDVSAGRNEPEILALAAERRAGVILMHMRGTPRDMQREPRYDDVVREVAAHLRARARAAWQAGVAPHRIALDPGLGFGKELAHNLELLRALPELASLGFPLVVGLSRKRFLGQLTNEERPERRGDATTAAVALTHARGAALHRVHDVGAARAALAIARALGEDG
jgi:dihydropteroate synthase